MDIFTDVEIENVLLGALFQCPHSTFELCLSVAAECAPALTALYSVLVALMFFFFWKIVSMLVVFFNPILPESPQTEPATAIHPYPEPRHVGLVGFWNAREPLEAVLFMLSYVCRIRRGKYSNRKPDISGPAIRLLVLAIVCLLGSYAASIFVAAQLIVGSVAPANPNKVYIPKLGVTDPADQMRLQALIAPASLRSLGSAEAASQHHTTRHRVSLDVPPRQPGSPYSLTYNYEVTAEDMGLQQHWPDLKQEVNGRCQTNDSWFDRNQGDEDVYRPWGLRNTTILVMRDGERKSAPRAISSIFPYANADFQIDTAAEYRYGIYVHSSHRASHSPGTDPWYETETFTPPANDSWNGKPPGYRVKSVRPALSCTQKDVWSYNGTRFKNVYELTDDANINFPAGWEYQLQRDFAAPRIVEMINSASASSLKSSMTFVGGRFDAQTSSIEDDIWPGVAGASGAVARAPRQPST